MRIQILVILLSFQSLVACQQQQGQSTSTVAASLAFERNAIAAGDSVHTSTAAASLAFEPLTDFRKDLASTLPATNIVFQSADNGQTWQDVSAGLPGDIAVGRTYANGNEIYLASESGLYHRSTALVAPVWEKEFFPGKSVTNIFPGQKGLYASDYNNGFFKGMPGTGIWNTMDNALSDKTVRAVLETPDGTVYVGCESGLYKSADNGKSWKLIFAESQINSLAVSGNVLVAGITGGLMRSTDGGEHWEQVLTGHGSAYGTERIEGGFVTITDGGNWKGGKPGAVFASTDEGKTWQRINTGLPMVRNIHDIIQAGKYFFCSTDIGIFRSSDSGKTWELVRDCINGKEIFHLAVSGNTVFAVQVFGC